MTMIEKVARSMFAAWRNHIDSESHFSGPREYDEMTPREREFSYISARAAISAMRKPTDKMMDAGVQNGSGYGKQPDTWEAMIDVALSEK